MREKLRETEATVDIYERLDAMPMSLTERARAKAELARAEYVVEIFARAARKVKRLVRSRIVRPLKRVLGTAGA